MGLANLFVKLRERSNQLKWTFYGALIVSVLADLVLPRHETNHELFWGDKIPGFWVAFAFIGCIVFIRICKGAAHTFLGKSEDYYD